MPYSIPKLADLSQRARQIFAQASPGATVDLWPNPFAVIAKVLAAIWYEIHLRLDWLARQLFASTADDEWLDRHGFELGIARLAAVRAVGPMTVSADTGVTIPAGVTYQRGDGAIFRSRTSAIGAGAVSISFEAVTPGLAGNTAAATTMTLQDNGGVASLSAIATVDAGGIGGGADREARETFRARVLARKRNPPQGGSASDWEAWARAGNANITRVFVDSFSNTDRRVWLSFLTTTGIPSGGDGAALQAYLADPNLRPVTARVTVVAPTAVPIAVTATGVLPLTTAVQAAINAELAALFAERMQVVTPNRAFTLPRAWVSEAISRATGEDRHTLTAPAADVTYSTAGQFPTLGIVTLS